MDDMNAFERQVGDEIFRIVGPARPVDDLAVFEVAANRQKGWGFTMFSALKFVAAAVIVALFGGFLLAGILSTQPSDELTPAAVTESPSPMTAEELLSGMVTEEVEPGVLRVINDGVRDLSYPLGGWGYSGFLVDVTPDGSVWMSVDEGHHGLFGLGEKPAFEDPFDHLRHRVVAPDGSLWALGIGGVPDDRSDFYESSGIFSFDGEGWTLRATTKGDPHTLAVGPGGTVWVASESALLRLEGDGSLTTMEDWSDVYDGDANLFQLAASPNGDVWLVGAPSYSLQGAELLLRFEGEGWEAIPGPEGWNPGPMGRYLDVGADGTLWVKASATGGLARFDDPGWTTVTEADGVEPWGEASWSDTDLLEVAADGSVWLLGGPTEELPPPGCGGVSHYDGTKWTSFLVETCIHDFAIAPDGSVWLGADDMASPLRLYVITPEAVEASE